MSLVDDLADSEFLDDLDQPENSEFIDDLSQPVTSESIDEFAEPMDPLVLAESSKVEEFVPDDNFDSVDLEDETDSILLDLQQTLTSLGYDVQDVSSTESLNKLLKREEECKRIVNNPKEIIEYFRKEYYEAKIKLQTSKATYEARKTNMNDFTYAVKINNPFLANESIKIIDMVHNEILRLTAYSENADIITQSDIKPKAILKQLLSTTDGVLNLSAYADVLLDYINTVIPLVFRQYSLDSMASKNDENTRSVTANILLQEENDNLHCLESGNLQPIRQVFRTADKTFIRCPQCSKEHSIVKMPLDFIFFQEEKNNAHFVFPKAISCDCGANLIFPFTDYFTALKSYVNKNKKDIQEFLNQSANFCKGASFLRVHPSIEQFQEDNSYIFCDYVSTETAIHDAIDHEDETVDIKPVDNAEFQQAVKDFYERLKGITSRESLTSTKVDGAANQASDEYKYVVDETAELTKNAYHGLSSSTSLNGLSVSMLAAYVSQCVGIDYSSVKMMALFSLVTNLKEDPILHDILNVDNLNKWKNQLALIQDTKADFNYLPDDVFTELLYFASKHVDNLMVDMADRNELRDVLRNLVPMFEQEIQSLEESYEITLDILEDCIYPLAFCPIANYQVYSLKDLINIFRDDRIFRVLSDISDYMIITNYAEDFFEYWKMLGIPGSKTDSSSGIMSNRDIQNTLLNSTDPNKIANAINSLYHFLLGHGLIVVNSDPEHIINLCSGMTLDEHKKLARIYKQVQTGNYYRFCKVLRDCYNSEDRPSFGFGSIFDNSCNHVLHSFLDQCDDILQHSELEYYLGSMFSQEELNKADSPLRSLTFGRYVLRRKSSESPEEYVARYFANLETQKHSVDTWVDTFSQFENKEYLLYIYFGSIICDMNSKNFVVETFITSICTLLLLNESSDISQSSLGLSEFQKNVISNTYTPWNFSQFNFVNNVDLCAILIGYYFAGFADEAIELSTALEQCLVKTTTTASDIHSLFDIHAEFSKALETVKNSILSDESSVSDMEQVVGELSLYASDKFVEELTANV